MGQAIAITRQDHSAADLRRVAGGSREGALVRRLLALVLEGCSRGGAARQSGMDRQTPCDWVHRYETEGVGGLGSRRSPGRAPALSQGRMAALKTLVIDGPDPERHKVVRWRCCDLQREIARRFSVEVHERTVGKWLRRLGLTRLQPRPFHPKKDAAAQEAFKKPSPA
jgi:transposase